MKDVNLTYGFEHWMALQTLGMAIEANMVEVPEGIVSIGDRVFHVGAFKIAKSLVTERTWGKVMGNETLHSRRYVTDVSFTQITDFLQRLRVTRKGPGYYSIPTEAQLLIAQDGYIRSCGKNKEICLTQFRNPDDMGEHHFFDNIPKEVPFDLVTRQGNNRNPLPYKQPSMDTGFRIVLIDYDTAKWQTAFQSLNYMLSNK